MPETVSLSFQDDRGVWHEMLRVDAAAIEITDHVPYEGDPADKFAWTDVNLSATADQVKFSSEDAVNRMRTTIGDTRPWRLIWLDEDGRELRRLERELRVTQEGGHSLFALKSERIQVAP